MNKRLGLDRFIQDSGLFMVGLDRLIQELGLDMFIQDSGLFRVWFRQVYTGFWFIRGLD
jgi:putative heme iron utilization protein